MLETRGLTTDYGPVRAITAVDIKVQEQEVVAIIGANGAGKTTLLKTISCLLKAREGKIKFLDADITRLPAHKVVEMGLVQVPEGRQLFGPLSVMQNLHLGAYCNYGRLKPSEIKQDIERVMNLFPVLAERANQKAATLSGGEQQMLAVGRALMSRPKMLVLDEPSIGLAPIIIDIIFGVLNDLNCNGMTMLLVEQNTALALDFANRAYVMENGLIVIEGEASKLKADAKVIDAYLAVEEVDDDDGS
jgi:branched-chain amino acid transport system ATP-binding protein